MLTALLNVFNGEKYISECIESVLNQTHKDFEFIIINDGSTDNTQKIIENYKDSRIKIINLYKNVGVGKAISIGLKAASGEFIAKIDADDVYDKNRFSKQINYLKNNKDIGLVDSLLHYFPDNEEVSNSHRYKYMKNILEKQVNNIISTESISQWIYSFPCITNSMVMFRKSILKKAIYNPNFRSGSDYYFFYNLNKTGVKMGKIPEVLGNVRVCQNSVTVKEKNNLLTRTFIIKEEEIDKIIQENNNIYIWGTGELGKEFNNYLINRYDIKVRAFIDSDIKKTNTILNNIKIKSINDILMKDDKYIFIASSIGKFEIEKVLKSNNLRHIDNYFILL